MAEVIPAAPPLDYLHETSKALVATLQEIREKNPDGLVDAISAGANSTESQQFMQAEIKQLSNTVMFIKGKFESVKMTLRLFDQKKYRKPKPDGTPGGDLIDPLEPKWEVHRLNFNRLVAESQEGARVGATFAKDYRMKILDMAKDETVPVTEIVGELEDYMEAIEKAANKSSDLSAGFERIRVDILTFKADMRAALGEATANLEKELVEASNHITTINEQIKKWTDVSGHGGRIAVSALGTGGTAAAGAVAAVAAITPVGWIALIGVGLAALGGAATWATAQSKLRGLRKELTEAQRRYEDLKKRQGDLKQLQIFFEKAEEDIDECAAKLVILARIWKIFSNDAKELKAKIAEIRGVKRGSALKRHIKMIEDVYLILQDNLSTYSTQIALVNEPEKTT